MATLFTPRLARGKTCASRGLGRDSFPVRNDSEGPPMNVSHLVRKSARDVLERVAPGYMHHRRLRLAVAPEKEIELLGVLCDKGTSAIDVGANKGLYVDHL